MALFGRRKRSIEQQYTGINTSVMIPRYTTPPERNTREWLDTFRKNPRLAVVNRIASDLSTCKGKLYKIDEVSGDEVEIQTHPFIDMMKRPNPLFEMTSGAVWRLLQIYLDLKGEPPHIVRTVQKRGLQGVEQANQRLAWRSESGARPVFVWRRSWL